MENWLDDNNLLIVGTNGISVIHYYGKQRTFSIKASLNCTDRDTDFINKAVKGLKKQIREAKPYIEPLHGCTTYI